MQKTILFAVLAVSLGPFTAFAQDSKPNIVLVFLDNSGWGEPGFNGGGIIRGAQQRHGSTNWQMRVSD